MQPDLDIGRAALLAGSCVIAGLLVPGLPLIGLPIAAMAIARLTTRGRGWLALAAIAVSVALVARIDPPAGLLVFVSMAAAGPLAVRALRRFPATVVAAGLSVVMFGVTIGTMALAAELAGSTLAAEVAKIAADAVDVFAAGVSNVDAARLEQLQRLAVGTWPATYMQLAAVTALLAVAAASRGAAGGHRQVQSFPSLGTLDLGVHVLWLPVLAVLGLATGKIVGASPLETAALNVLLFSRVPLALQGLGVLSAVLERSHAGRFSRATVYAFAVAIEVVTYAVSIVGLIDFWANFRRLPRDGGPPPAALEEPGSPG